MRQSAHQVETSSAWKQEVNRRVAQHQGRKGQSAATESVSSAAQGSVADGKTAIRPSNNAAARVAERYAKVPSYSEMMAREARAAMRAAEIVPAEEFVARPAAVETPEAVDSPEIPTPVNSWENRAPVASSANAVSASFAQPLQIQMEPAPSKQLQAMQAHAAQTEPSGMRAADPILGKAVSLSPSSSSYVGLPPAKPATSERPFEIRWDADLPVRGGQQGLSRAFRGDSIYEVDAAIVPKQGRDEAFELSELDVVEPGQPIHANLIHFPRELVAANKARPRRIEGTHGALAEAQLSIFEAEPATVRDATEPAKPVMKTDTPTWAGMQWSASQQNDEPAKESSYRSAGSSPMDRAAESSVQKAGRVAPLNRRILAAMVDFCLITGAFLAAAVVGALNATVLPPPHELELGSVVALALTAVFYQALFFGLSIATPGMQYAGLELCTFAGKRPALSQRFARAVALIVSLLPLGLGVAWSLFDDQELSWHDRLSGTYLRKA